MPHHFKSLAPRQRLETSKRFNHFVVESADFGARWAAPSPHPTFHHISETVEYTGTCVASVLLTIGVR
jgi:hypothetical protein